MQIVENCAVPDVFVTGMADPEDLGNGNIRYTFYARRRSIHDGTSEREIVCRLIIPANVVLANIKIVLEALGIAEAPCGRKCGIALH